MFIIYIINFNLTSPSPIKVSPLIFPPFLLLNKSILLTLLILVHRPKPSKYDSPALD